MKGLNVPQREITIGVPAYPSPEDVTLGQSLELPFRPQRPWRLLPGNGEPTREAVALSDTRLRP